MAMYNVVWENGRVALTKCMILGLCAMSENGWYPIKDLDMEDRQLVWRLVDNNPGCVFKDELWEFCRPQ